MFAIYCIRARRNEGSCCSIQVRSTVSAARSAGTIDAVGERYDAQQQRFSTTCGFRRLVAWTRNVTPPLPTPQIHLPAHDFIDRSRMASTSAPVSCKESISTYSFIVANLHVDNACL